MLNTGVLQISSACNTFTLMFEKGKKQTTMDAQQILILCYPRTKLLLHALWAKHANWTLGNGTLIRSQKQRTCHHLIIPNIIQSRLSCHIPISRLGILSSSKPKLLQNFYDSCVVLFSLFARRLLILNLAKSKPHISSKMKFDTPFNALCGNLSTETKIILKKKYWCRI